MNIAEIATDKAGGGIYTHVVDLAKGIKGNILIITGNTRKQGYEEKDGLKFFHVPCLFSIKNIYFASRLGSYKLVCKILKENNIELVHFHNPLYTFLNEFIIKKSKLPCIITAHYVIDLKGNKVTSFLYKKIIKWTTVWISNHVDKIVCVNQDYIQNFKKWGVKPEKLIFIPNGVDTKKFSPGASEIKDKYENDKLIVFFGRLHYQKNVDYLIRSFNLLKEENVKLIIIGSGPDADRLKDLSKNNKNIIMTGRVSDKELLDYLKAAYAMVLPSRGETASLTLMEAMACQLPVIASDVGNARKMLSDGRGIILEEYTEQELAEKMNYLLKNEKEAKDMGRKSMEFIKKYYSKENTCKKTEELYKTLIK